MSAAAPAGFSSSASSSSSTGGPFTSSAPSSRDLSYLLSGQSPAQLLAELEAKELALRRMHHILAQEQQRVKQEEALIRDKLQRAAQQPPSPSSHER